MNTNDQNEVVCNFLAAWERIEAREKAFAHYGLWYEDDGEVTYITDVRALDEDEELGHKLVAELPSTLGVILADALRMHAEPTHEDVRLFRASLGLTA